MARQVSRRPKMHSQFTTCRRPIAHLCVEQLEAREVLSILFDFGTAKSPVASGYTQVTSKTTYTTTQHYGWLSGIISEQDYPQEKDPLTRDFNSTSNGTFAADVANGTYTVAVTMGSAFSAERNMGVFLQGAQVDSVSTSAPGQFAVRTYTVSVGNGQLDLGLRNLGGDNPVMNGLTITLI